MGKEREIQILAVIGLRGLRRRKNDREFQEVLHFVMDTSEVIGEIIVIEPLEFPLHAVRRSVEIEKSVEMSRGTHTMLVTDTRNTLAILGWNMERLEEIIPFCALLAFGEWRESIQWSHKNKGNRSEKERTMECAMCVEDVSWSRKDERYFPPDPPPSTHAGR